MQFMALQYITNLIIKSYYHSHADGVSHFFHMYIFKLFLTLHILKLSQPSAILFRH